jgi:hypothetical protein
LGRGDISTVERKRPPERTGDALRPFCFGQLSILGTTALIQTLVDMPRFYLHEAFCCMPADLIRRNAQPVGHISPYPRIDLSPVRTASAKPQVVSAMEERKRTMEVERIWRLVVQVAQGN